MAINKAWYFAVKGINIDCSAVGTKKLKDKKGPANCKRKKTIDKIKKREDNIDEDAVKIAEMRAVKKSDMINQSEIYDNRRVTEGFNSLQANNINSQEDVFFVNPQSDNPLEKSGYTNKKQAIMACNQYNAKLATKDQMIDAYTNKKINWCSYGWLDNKEGEVCLPLQPDFLTDKQISQGLCGSNSSGAGIKCINPLKNEPYGATCYGKKPNVNRNMLK